MVAQNRTDMSSTATPRRRFRIPGRNRPKPPAHIRPDGSRDVELPLIEHLRELRSRLIKAALAIVITTGISLTFAQQEVDVLVRLASPHLLIALKPTEVFVSYIKV